MPYWALLLVIIVAASLIAGFELVPTFLGQRPDFKVSATPSSQTLLAGSGGLGGEFYVNVMSLNNFAGMISAGIDNPSGVKTSLSVQPLSNPDAIPLSHTVTIQVNVGATAVGNYTVTVFVTSGKISHSVSALVVAQGLRITSSPTPLNIAYGSLGNEALIISGQNGISGALTIAASVPGAAPSGVASNTVSVDQVLSANLELCLGGTVTSTVVVDARGPDGCAVTCGYVLSSGVGVTITVQGTQGPMVYVGYTFWEVVNESLALQGYSFSSSTNVTLDLTNRGSNPVYLGSYVIADPHGDQYSGSSHSGLFDDPANTISVNLLIGANCPGCTLTGSPFTLDVGQKYVISIITGRSNQFKFSVTR